MNFRKVYQTFLKKINQIRSQKEVNLTPILSTLSKLDQSEYSKSKKIKNIAQDIAAKSSINNLIISSKSKIDSCSISRAIPNNSATQALMDQITKTIELPSKHS